MGCHLRAHPVTSNYSKLKEPVTYQHVNIQIISNSENTLEMADEKTPLNVSLESTEELIIAI